MLFFKPRGAWCADVIPFFHDGTYHLFYLRSHRDREGFGEGTPWGHVATQDFVHFEELPDAILPGTRDDQDLWPFTGSVIERDGTFHIFYTGHNPHLEGTDRPIQGIMHATSPDLVAWTKDAAFPLFVADRDRYEPGDWRDPFVFWNAEAGEYWMLIAARHDDGPKHRRGLMGLASSPDLATWTIRDPFWDPRAFHTHECPDLFQADGRWYLFFSTTTLDDRVATQYRSAPSLAGPWRIHGDGSLDGFAWYAAKTATDGDRRFAFGWLPSHPRDDLAVAPMASWSTSMDASGWLWGGQMVVHEVTLRPGGALGVRAPDEVTAVCDAPAHLAVGSTQGTWSFTDGTLVGTAGDGHAWTLLGEMPETGLVRASITFEEGAHELGLLLRASPTLDRYYRLRIDPTRQRVVFERFPKSDYETFIVERPLEVTPGVPIDLTLLVDGSAFVAYLDGAVALSTRGSDHVRGQLGAFVTGAGVRLDGLEMRSLGRSPAGRAG